MMGSSTFRVTENEPLCNYCTDHFDVSNWQYWLEAKTNALDLLQSKDISGNITDALQLDLNRYKSDLVRRGEEDAWPCPWFSGDLDLPMLEEEWTMDRQVWRGCYRGDFESEGRLGQSVGRTASSGCHMCTLLCSITSTLPASNSVADFEFGSWTTFHAVTLQPLCIEFRIFQSVEEVHWRTLRLLSTNKCSGFRDSSLIDPYSGSASSLNVLLDNLSECVSSHKKCASKKLWRWSPTRLLDVGPSTEMSDTIFLVEKDDLPLVGDNNLPEYITLSHMWGNQEFYRLETKKLHDCKKYGIQTKLLPKCIQDAVYFIRQTPYRYLWVDSLCILQDSEEDWATESSVMHLVYSMGVCNLAACNATDSSIGLFADRDPALGTEFTSRLTFFGQELELTFFFDWYATVQAAPLYQRGWVLQERLLSPRTIHFTQFPFLECREDLVCEIYRSKTSSTRFKWISTPSRTMENIGEWGSVIYDYSRCKLTKPTDRLIALSGIAKRMSALSKGHYIAGLWTDHLLDGLLWHVAKFSTGHTRSASRGTVYIAPTWSWTSVDEPVVPFTDDISEPLVVVTRMAVKPMHHDIFGQLAGCEIELEAHLFKMPDWLSVRQSHKKFRHSLKFDDWAWNIDAGDFPKDDEFDNPTDTIRFLPILVSSDEELRPGLVICGLIVEKERQAQPYHRPSSHKRIKERRDDPPRPSSYKRIGTAIVSEDGEIAGSGWHLTDWWPRPWTATMNRQRIILV